MGKDKSDQIVSIKMNEELAIERKQNCGLRTPESWIDLNLQKSKQTAKTCGGVEEEGGPFPFWNKR